MVSEGGGRGGFSVEERVEGWEGGYEGLGLGRTRRLVAMMYLSELDHSRLVVIDMEKAMHQMKRMTKSANDADRAGQPTAFCGMCL